MNTLKIGVRVIIHNVRKLQIWSNKVVFVSEQHFQPIVIYYSSSLGLFISYEEN